MSQTQANVDLNEVAKFDALASSWWDLEGQSKPLHDLNPIRLAYIAKRTTLSDANVIDVGCGGGINIIAALLLAFDDVITKHA